ncbi:hypothetical protein ERJ75_000949200 [Trypanosoma vivax]|uniref:Uncharacterized protein n=1 Tax=Trypanosoma vivax (strain Y486) TaxID=1055687 RepID=G0U4K2_TRYVY|nr:hypothetical protein TRVL_02300 [Trypanosoma vivax]KAH8611254.1 hypothetical protein ERJ75_000949200 [Trypanosoma vivax]CCC52366.1 conserved hypothetical protein [Trypanosoma vivax Y486]
MQSKSYSVLSESAWESRESDSGYSQEKQVDIDDSSLRAYRQRLCRFYERYNPSKLGDVDHHLGIYRGKEEHLFAILVNKYGPEPEPLVAGGTHPDNSYSRSECDLFVHRTGRRYEFPVSVSPAQGNTDRETPYWANSALISERDILALLCNLETKNDELQKCYIGLLAQHPTSSWNGMVYVTRDECIAPSGTIFLGHLWSSTLGNQKSMVHEGAAYHRATFYCTDQCQRCGGHERWRLSVYISEMSSLYLVRVVWDPVIFLEPPSLAHCMTSFHSSSEALQSVGFSASRACSHIDGTEPLQPLHPPVSVSVRRIVSLLEGLEKKVSERFDALEARMMCIESKLADLPANVPAGDDK